MLAKNITRQFLNQILTLITSFIMSVITARILGAEGRGNFALILNTSGFLNLLLGLSLGSVIVHVISTEKTPFRNTINSLSVIMAALILFSVLLLAFFPFDKFKFFLPSVENVFFWKFFLVFLFASSLLTTMMNSILAGKKMFLEQQRIYFWLAIFSCSSFILLYFLKAKLNIDFRFFIIFHLVMTAVTVVLVYGTYFKKIRPPFTFSFLTKNQLKYVLNFSFIAYVANIFQFLSYKMDFWFVEHYNGSQQLGIYSLAVGLAQMLWLLPQAIAAILIAYSGSDIQERAVSQTNALVRITLNIILIIAVILSGIIDFVIPFLYGVEFTESAFLFKVLLIGIVPFSITTIIASYFAGRGEIKVNLYGGILGFVFCLLFDIILIPLYGNKGAAIATVISYFISTVYTIIVYMRRNNTPLLHLLVMNTADFVLLKNKFQNVFFKK
jgi:O-antigen/teichoic acid export membrane protein